MKNLLKMDKKILIPGIIVVIIALGYGGLELTMSSRFCGSCHNMKPYYHEWQSSNHKSVACVKCHIEPGFVNLVKRKINASYELVSVITGKIPSRPHSDVRDVICFRPGCHTPQKIEESKTISFGKSVRFDHSIHLGETPAGKLRCTVCHSQRGGGDHVGLNTEACILCHYKMTSIEDRHENEFCLSCHTVPENDVTIEETGLSFSHADHSGEGVNCRNCHIEHLSGSGDVSVSNCTRCHKEPALIEKAGDVELLHAAHIQGHKTECYYCHSEISHSAKNNTFVEQSNCNQCHGSSHKVSEQMYRGRGGRGVEEMPAMKFTLGIDCNGCHRHTEVKGSMESTSAADGCIACHGDGAQTYLKDWKTELNNSSKELAVLITEAGRTAQKSSEVEKYLDDARYNLEFVNEARGVHNLEYALKLLEYSKELVAKAREESAAVIAK